MTKPVADASSRLPLAFFVLGVGAMPRKERVRRKYGVTISLRLIEWQAVRDAADSCDLLPSVFAREAAVKAAGERLQRLAATSQES